MYMKNKYSTYIKLEFKLTSKKQHKIVVKILILLTGNFLRIKPLSDDLSLMSPPDRFTIIHVV